MAKQKCGGMRVDPQEDLECDPGCVEWHRYEMINDETTYLPTNDPLPPIPPDDPDKPPPSPNPGFGGTCQLRASWVEVLSCRSASESGLPPCMSKSKLLSTIHIADLGVDSELLCRLDSFRPFHRIGRSEDVHVRAGEAFTPNTDGANARNMASEFVRNIDPADMTISGAPWLGLESGWLVGVAPNVTKLTEYPFEVIATNPNGRGTVSLLVIVSP